MTHFLSVYVARHCFGTTEAVRLVGEVRQRLPGLQVEVVMLDEMPVVDTRNVPATPCYIMDDRLLFLGNPRLDELITKIASLSKDKGENHE